MLPWTKAIYDVSISIALVWQDCRHLRIPCYGEKNDEGSRAVLLDLRPH